MNSSVSALTVSAPLLRLVEQLERRQRRVGQVLEERRLLFLLHPLRAPDLHRRRRDHQRRVVLLAPAFGLHDGLALFARVLADFLVAAPLPGAEREGVRRLEQKSGEFRDAQPGHADEQAEAHSDRRQHEQRRAGEARQAGELSREHRADDAAGFLRQATAETVQAQRFERRARDEEQAEPRGGEPQRPRFRARGAVEPTVAARHGPRA